MIENIHTYSCSLFSCSAILFREAYGFYRDSAKAFNSQIRRKIRFVIESIFFTYTIPVAFQLACAFSLLFVTPASNHYGIFSSVNAYTTALFSLLSTTWSTIRYKAHQTGTTSKAGSASHHSPSSFNPTSTILGGLYTNYQPDKKDDKEGSSGVDSIECHISQDKEGQHGVGDDSES
jgi:hypothetical protein